MKKKICISYFVFCLFFSFTSVVYGYTVDDVRDLLGKDRVDDIYTQEEINYITQEYSKIEAQNKQYELFEIANDKNTVSNSELIKKRIELEEKLENAKIDFSTIFQSGVALPEVLKKKSSVESIMTEIDRLGNLKDMFEVEYIPNTWKEEYEKVNRVVESLNSQYDLGEVGKSMKIPVNYGFYIEYPFGFRINPFTLDSVEMHNGIDFIISDGTVVFSQWNGIVSNVIGDIVEISHGPDLKTVYYHLTDIVVNIGDKVSQYQVIGKANGVGYCYTNKPHLHFEVILDNEFIDPLYLYGSKSLIAFKDFVSEHPKLDFDTKVIERNIKDYPSKITESIKIIGNSPITSVGLETKFSRKDFFSNINKWYEDVETKENYKNVVLGE